MTRRTTKLYSGRTWLIMLSALFVGSGLSLYREHRNTGALETSSLVISIITFLVGVAICGGVSWWGNRPERRRQE